MKYLKYFESIEKYPEIGDYVICKDNESEDKDENDIEFENFLNHSVGMILDSNKEKNNFFKTITGKRFENYSIPIYLIQFENELPEFIKEPDFPENSLIFDENEIVVFSKNKDELEILLSAKKYNL